MFSEIAERWKNEHIDSLSPASWDQCYSFPFEEIKEYFKDEYIKNITYKDIKKYMSQLPKSYARKTCANRLTILNMIFEFAVIEDILSENPCSYITVPKGHGSTKRRAPTSDEIKRIKKRVSM